MKALPHQYKVKVEGKPVDNLTVYADHLPALQVAPPAQFDGPGDQWSPEELLMASVANCVVLSFRAIAKVSRLNWLSIECEVNGELGKVGNQIKFTEIWTKANLLIPSGERIDKAEKLLNKAEETCFISNSLCCDFHFECQVQAKGD